MDKWRYHPQVVLTVGSMSIKAVPYDDGLGEAVTVSCQRRHCGLEMNFFPFSSVLIDAETE